MKHFLLLYTLIACTTYVSAQNGIKSKKQLTKVTEFRWDNILNQISKDTAKVTTVEWSATGAPLEIIERTIMANGVVSIHTLTDFFYNPGFTPEGYYLIRDWNFKKLEVVYENSDSGSSFTPLRRISYFDSAGNITVREAFDFLNGSWVLKSKSENFYDSLGNFIGFKSFGIVNNQPKLFDGERYTNEYNSIGDLIKIKVESYEGGKWVWKIDKQLEYASDRKTKAMYGLNNINTDVIKDSMVYEWHRFKPQYMYHVDAQPKVDKNLIKSAIRYVHPYPNFPLKPQSRYTYAYNSQDLQTLRLEEAYIGSQWEPLSKTISSYYPNGDLKYKVDSMLIYSGNNIWKELMRDTFDNTYDADGDITAMISITNNIVRYKRIYEYNESYSIPEEMLFQDVVLYPNPAASTLNIDWPQSISYKFTITDLTGKVILKKIFSGSSSIDISYLEQGTYIAILENNGVREYRKFIKQ